MKKFFLLDITRDPVSVLKKISHRKIHMNMTTVMEEKMMKRMKKWTLNIMESKKLLLLYKHLGEIIS
jgi:hypothetical protein